MMLTINHKSKKQIYVNGKKGVTHEFNVSDPDEIEVILESVQMGDNYQFWAWLPESMTAIRDSIKYGRSQSLFCGPLEISVRM